MKLRMVDRILEWGPGEGIRGIMAVSLEEYLLKEPFGGEARLPDMLLLQAAFELGAWFLILRSDFREGGIAAGFGEVAFLSQAAPGERVFLDLRLEEEGNGRVRMEASGKVGERPVLAAHAIALQPIPLKSLGDPEDYRTLASEIGAGDLRERP